LPQSAAPHRSEAVWLWCVAGNDVVLAAKAATSTIPIVFSIGLDPIQMGVVASLSRPGGNITGVYYLSAALMPKRLELLSELVPGAGTFAFLTDPKNPNSDPQVKDLKAAANSMGKLLLVLTASSRSDFEAAFAKLADNHAVGLIVAGAALFQSSVDELVTLSARHKVPTVYSGRDFAAAGGLASYGSDISDAYRLAGIYTGQILKGGTAADLPVQQSTRVNLAINMKTAKALGLTFPLSLLGRARLRRCGSSSPLRSIGPTSSNT